MLLFLFLTIASLLVLLMGFMGIRIPFLVHASEGFHAHEKPPAKPAQQGVSIQNKENAGRTFRHAPNHHTIESNRGIFSKPSAEPDPVG